jgi:hypothetical protein
VVSRQLFVVMRLPRSGAGGEIMQHEQLTTDH